MLLNFIPTFFRMSKSLTEPKISITKVFYFSALKQMFTKNHCHQLVEQTNISVTRVSF